MRINLGIFELSSTFAIVPDGDATLDQMPLTLCTSILSVIAGFGTKRTRGPSWYQTPAGRGRLVCPVEAEMRDWGRGPCGAAARRSRLGRAPMSGAG